MKIIAFGILALISAHRSAMAGEAIVTVIGANAAAGDIGCALFTQADGFPADSTKAESRQLHAAGSSVQCNFKGLKAGRYAATAVQYDKGSNSFTYDLIGRPQQAWGVSNNVRPKLRAPRFDEAGFAVSETGVTRENIQLSK